MNTVKMNKIIELYCRLHEFYCRLRIRYGLYKSTYCVDCLPKKNAFIYWAINERYSRLVEVKKHCGIK